jgi:hypothetical protein
LAHAVKRGDGEEEEDADVAAALPHVVALVGVPIVYCCGGVYCERSVCCCGGAEESKGGDGEKEKDGDVAAALPRALAPVGASSVYSCGGAEERKGCDGDAAATFSHAMAPVGAPSAAAAGLYGEWRGYRQSRCCAEQRRFRRDKVTRRDSVSRRATFDNWRLAAEQGSQMAWSVTTVHPGVKKSHIS